MLEQINHSLFLMINATPATSHGIILLATFIAKYLILIFPITTVGFWLWGSQPVLTAQRRFVCKSAIALIIGLSISYIIGVLIPHDRPFVESFGSSFLQHAATPSFPSNHGIIAFTFALSFLFWQQIRLGIAMIVIALTVAWSRVYLGVHWPIDMVGALITALISCACTQLLWSVFGTNIQQLMQKAYTICFNIPIQKGWVQN